MEKTREWYEARQPIFDGLVSLWAKVTGGHYEEVLFHLVFKTRDEVVDFYYTDADDAVEYMTETIKNYLTA